MLPDLCCLWEKFPYLGLWLCGEKGKEAGKRAGGKQRLRVDACSSDNALRSTWWCEEETTCIRVDFRVLI